MNECDTEMDECHMNAECNNTFGNYTCACNEGYIGDGFQCTGTYVCILHKINVV